MAKLRFDNYERKRLKTIAGLCVPGTILDLGYAQTPNPFLPGTSCTGVDLQTPSEYCNYDEQLIGDVTQLESTLAGRTFDNIIAGELIEHLERPYDFLRSLQLFMKPNSRLLISTPNPVAWPCIIFEWLRNENFYYSDDHLYYIPPRWVLRMLDICQFKLHKICGVGFLMPFYSPPSPVALSYQVIYAAHLKDVSPNAKDL